LKTADVISAEKLRGGFYSPPTLVRACLDRVATLSSGNPAPLRFFEPSAGDGAFIRGLNDHSLARRVKDVTAVEVNAGEAAKTRRTLSASPFDGTVVAGSVLTGARPGPGEYDVAVGNPPFVRFQFLTDDDRAGALATAQDSGLS